MRKSLGYWMKDEDKKVMLVGLLFCRPSTKIARDEILPALFDFHYSSDTVTHFYFPGYDQKEEATLETIGARKVEAPEFEYNPKKFNEFVKFVEEKSSWKYSGGTDLLLVNARYNSSRQEAYLDFSSSIPLTLEVIKSKGAYPEVGMLFEKIFNFAESNSGKDPVSALSDELGKSIVIDTGKELAYRLLPSETKDKVKEGLQYASIDLRRSKAPNK